MSNEVSVLLQYPEEGQQQQPPPRPMTETASTLCVAQSEGLHYLENEFEAREPPFKSPRKRSCTTVGDRLSFQQQGTPHEQWLEPLQYMHGTDWSHLLSKHPQPQLQSCAASRSPEEGRNQCGQHQRGGIHQITAPRITQFATAKRGPGRPRGQSLRSYQAQSGYEATLEKNRIAARNYRRRDAEATKRLKLQAEDYTSENEALKERIKVLREEVLTLKYALLQHASCGFQAIDDYVQKYVKDVAGTGSSVQAKGLVIED